MTATRPSDAPYGPQDTGTDSEAGPEGNGPPQEPSEPCLFCDRAAHEILGESYSWYIRLDAYPANPGHVEVVTKRHVESFFGLDGNESGELYGVLAYARNLVEARFGTPDGWTIGINEGRAAGRSIDHLHVHLIPRHHGDVPDPRGGIRRGLPNGNPDAWGATPPQGDTALRERLAKVERERKTTAEALDGAAIIIVSLKEQRDEARAALREFVSDTPCDPHPGNGFCQTHGERKPCPHAAAKRLLDRPEGT